MTKFQIATEPSCEIDSEEPLERIPSRYSSPISLSEFGNPTVKGRCLRLDGTLSSALDWSDILDHARAFVNEGGHILWDLDLGLFDGLERPLEDEAQLRSLKLAVQHFRETVWEVFKENTIGVNLYSDTVLFERFPGNDFVNEAQVDPLVLAYQRRDIASHYLSLITTSMPEDLRMFAQMKVSDNLPLSVALALTNPDCFERLEWILTASHSLHSSWKREGDMLVKSSSQASSAGFCIPTSDWMPREAGSVDGLFAQYPKLRLIPEQALLSHWEQLDDLYVLESHLTPFGRRQLQGFEAAGGSIEFIK